VEERRYQTWQESENMCGWVVGLAAAVVVVNIEAKPTVFSK
jgi:hypothetical protein